MPSFSIRIVLLPQTITESFFEIHVGSTWFVKTSHKKRSFSNIKLIDK